MLVKLRYFAWVRERVGKPEEDIEVPAGVGTVAERKAQWRLLWLIILATVPAVILGFVFEKFLKNLFASPIIAAVFLVVNGCVLFAAERLRRKGGIRVLGEMGWRQALIIGLWQSAALIPGISRSGTTMVGGLSSVGTGDALDGWSKSTTAQVWREDNAVNAKAGSKYSCGYKKGASSTEFLYSTISGRDVTPFLGRTVVFGVWVYHKVKGGSGTWRIRLQSDGTGAVNAASASATTTAFEWKEVSATIPSDATNFSAVSSLFAGTSGVATTLNTVLTNELASGGPVATRITDLTNQSDALTQQSNQLTAQMSALSASLTTQYSQLDSLLSSLQSTSSFLTQQFATLPLVQGTQNA